MHRRVVLWSLLWVAATLLFLAAVVVFLWPHPAAPASAPTPEVSRAVGPLEIASKLSSGPDRRDEAMRALSELKALGINARPAARAVCRLAVQSSGETRRAALETLEAICPPMAPHVTTLLVDKDPTRARDAVSALRTAGCVDAAAPAIADSLPRVARAWRGKGVVSASHDAAIGEHVDALLLLGCDDAEAFDAVAECVLIPIASGSPDLKVRVSELVQLRLLAKAKTDAGGRPKLLGMVGKATDGGFHTRKTIQAIGNLGKDAAPLAEPLRRLKLSPDAQTRGQATEALKAIEK